MSSLFTTDYSWMLQATKSNVSIVVSFDVDLHFLHVLLADGVWEGQPPLLAIIAAHINRIANRMDKRHRDAIVCAVKKREWTKSDRRMMRRAHNQAHTRR